MSYGSDFHCVTDLDFALTFLSTEEEQEQALLESVARRFRQIQGGIWYAVNVGLDIRQFTSDVLPQEVVKTLINNQARLDERIVECQSEIRIDDEGAWIVSIFPKPFNRDTPFELVFKVTSEKVETIVQSTGESS
jgi:hypothetical protein